MSKETNKRNGMIDLMRFIFAIIIVIYHGGLGLYKPFNEKIIYFINGDLAVEFFFIVSGYLLAKSISKNDNKNLLNSSYNFLKKKILSFYPAFFLCWICSFIIINIFFYQGKQTLIIRLFESIFELLLLRNAGFNAFKVMPQTWYLSAMIFSMLIIYPLCQKYKEYFQGYIAPVISIILLGFLYFKGVVNSGAHFDYFYAGTIRAFSEICLGIYCYFLSTKLKKVNFTKFGTFLLTLIEFLGYLFGIMYMQFSPLFNGHFGYILIIFFAISITISFSNKSLSLKIFKGNFWNFLGKFSLYPFLIYYPIVSIIPILFPGLVSNQMMIIYLILTLISSVIIYFVEKYFVKFIRYIKKFIIC